MEDPQKVIDIVEGMSLVEGHSLEETREENLCELHDYSDESACPG
jgi:hypothetical protein